MKTPKPKTPNILTVAEMSSMGGKARAKVLSPERIREIGRIGAEKRWGKKTEAAQKLNPA